MPQPTVLIATADQALSDHLAAQLDADGHPLYVADDRAAATAKLSAHAIDVVVLGALHAPAAAIAFLRDLRADALDARVHPGQPVITLGATDDLSILRAYEAGSDHHVAADTNYLVLRAVIATLARRTLEEHTSRHIHVGDLHIDTAAQTADIAGEPVRLSQKEYALLAQLASDPDRLFSKDQLMRTIWGHNAGRTRTLDSHAARLRKVLEAAGGHGLVRNRHGQGYQLRSGQ